MKLITVLAIGALVAAVVPIGIIWSLNTLFALSIAYSLKTWAAVAFLCLLVALMNFTAN